MTEGEDMDASWKRMQEKTFTNWVNEQLKVQKMAVTSLAKDFADGVVLIVLLEVLSQKKVGRYNKKPKMRAQQSENIEKVLAFIKSEGIRLVNIGAGDIIEGNIKLILGLVWTLILHYQISMGFNIDEDPESGQKRSGKQALLEYIQSKIPHKNIKNFTTDWNDGTAIAALVEAHAPGLCPDAEAMNPNNSVQNATKAMQLADDWLGIPQVLGPEDMTNPHVDELSMMTYLSQFPDCQLKDGAPIGGAKEPVDPTKVKVSGAGVTGEGAKVGSPAPIIVDCEESGVAPVAVKVTTPSGGTMDVPLKPKGGNPKAKVFEGAYNPSEPGNYTVEVAFDDEPLPDSPYSVAIGDPSAVRVEGDGLDTAIVGEDNIIDVFTDKAGPGDIDVDISGPSGAPAIKPNIRKVGDDHYQVSYKPEKPGPYKAAVKFNDTPIASKPIQINAVDPTKVKVSGPGVTGEGAKVGAPAPIVVDCEESGVAPLSVQVTKPSGEVVDVPLKPKRGSGDKVFEGAYTPDAPGNYNVGVNFNDKPLADSPYNVGIGDPSAVRLAGDGLSNAVVGEDNVIDVFTDKAGPGDVGVEFHSPRGVPPIEAEVVTVDDDHYQIVYKVPEVGPYQVGVKFNDMPVEKKPHDITAIDPNKVLVTGPGIQPEGTHANSKTYFDVDATKAGDAGTTISVKDPSGAEVPLDLVPIGKNSYRASYTPTEQGDYDVDVKFGGKDVKDAPFKVKVGEPAQVRCYGDGLAGAVVDVPTQFTVDASEVGTGGLGLGMEGPAEMVDVSADESSPGVYVIKYTAPKPGKYRINVKFNDEVVPGGPFDIVVTDNRGDPDASKCFVTNIENPGEFGVDCSQGGGSGMLEVGAKGAYVPADYVNVTHNGDYTFSVSYHISQPGETIISVKWHGEHLKGSPFTVITD